MKSKALLNLALCSSLLFTSLGALLKDDFSYHNHDDSCQQTADDTIYVHLVPHSHDDVGWLKTVDEYYIGSNNYI